MMIPLGAEEKEYFIFQYNFEINIDYGFITDKFTPGEDQYISGAGRSRGPFRRLRLFKNGKIISEYMVKLVFNYSFFFYTGII